MFYCYYSNFTEIILTLKSFAIKQHQYCFQFFPSLYLSIFKYYKKFNILKIQFK